MKKIVISVDEIAQTTRPADEPVALSTKLSPAIPRWAKACLIPLVLVLPILCVVSILIRVAVRGLPPRSRFAWVSFFSTLLAISGIVTSVGGVIAFSVSPAPSVTSQGLSELDSRTTFPTLPADHDLTAEEVSTELKPLVAVITPARRNWFSHSDEPSNIFGAGILLEATAEGYLIATARHVVDGGLGKAGGNSVLVASTSGTWASADVVARHQNLDLLLIWLPRRSGKAGFTLPVSGVEELKDGQTIYVIGHPQGLRFTLSTGIISRKDQDALQISAPVSPGNSGGPLFDTRGKLAGIVTSMIDKNQSPNSENLNFAVRADALLEISAWTFSGDGRRYLTSFQQAQHFDSH
jgi:S1-C subfamily serine protease